MPPKQSPLEVLTIADLYEVAALLAAGVELVGQKFLGSRVVFSFADSDGSATETLSAHRNRRLSLPTLDITDALKRAKDLTFAIRRDMGAY